MLSYSGYENSKNYIIPIFLNLSKDIRFDELRKVLESYGYEMNAREVEAVIIHLEKKVVCQLRYQSMSQLRKFILDGEIDRRK